MTHEHAAQSPTGDVEYDEEALREAQRRMHVSPGDGHARELDPRDDHDVEALKKAAKRMGAD
jgi:hypothetical protein